MLRSIYQTKNVATSSCRNSSAIYCYHILPRDATQSAVLLYGKSSVRPSVRLSVTLVDCDHIGWNCSKIISRLDSLACSLSADPTLWIYSKGNTQKFWPEKPGIGMGYEKGLSVYKSSNILKRGKIGPIIGLLLRTNKKFRTRFGLVPKSMILDDLERSLFYLRCRHRSLCSVSVRVPDVKNCKWRLNRWWRPGFAVARWSWFTSGPVNTWMGDRLRAGKPSRYVTSHLGQLSLSSPGIDKSSTSLHWLGLGRGVFACVWWQVTLCDPIWQAVPRSSEMAFH